MSAYSGPTKSQFLEYGARGQQTLTMQNAARQKWRAGTPLSLLGKGTVDSPMLHFPCCQPFFIISVLTFLHNASFQALMEQNNQRPLTKLRRKRNATESPSVLSYPPIVRQVMMEELAHIERKLGLQQVTKSFPPDLYWFRQLSLKIGSLSNWLKLMKRDYQRDLSRIQDSLWTGSKKSIQNSNGTRCSQFKADSDNNVASNRPSKSYFQ